MSYSSEVLADSPVIWLKLDEASGGFADSGSDGLGFGEGVVTYRQAPLVTDGLYSVASTGSFLALRSSVPASLAGDNVSQEVWVNIPSGNQKGTFTHVGTGSAGWGFGIGNGSNTSIAGRKLTVLIAGVAFYDSGHTFTDGTHHIVMTHTTGSNFVIYVDGSQVFSGTFATPPSAGAGVGVGTLVGAGGYDLSSGIRVDHPAFYASALSSVRVGAHYAAGAGLSLYMPDVTVEIAFNAGVRTPAADRVWTDVSTYVELDREINIDQWRGDEFSTCDANQLRLTFDNRDGRFTPGKSSSPYYPNVKIGRPIRVTSVTLADVAVVLFVGFIDEWPLEWDGSDQAAYSQVAASSRLARLGSDRKLRSIVEEEYLVDAPNAYYPLSEATGATSAADASGASRASLTQVGSGAAVTFGTATGPGTDELTAATFAGGKALRANFTPTTPTAAWIECFFSTTTSGATSYLVDANDGIGSDLHTLSLVIQADGTLRGIASGSASVLVDSVSVVNDGATHHALLVAVNGGNTVLYLDGVAVDTDATANTLDPIARVTVGDQDLALGAGPFTGTIAHFAIGYSTITATRAAAHANSGLTGFLSETPGTRFARYASYADIPAAEVDADAGTSPMVHIDTTDKTVLELLRTVETTEGGVLFDGRDGTLEFRSRSSRYTATSAFTLSVASQQIEAGMSPKLDRSAIQNDVTATLTDGTGAARAVNSSSVDDHGAKGEDIELATTDVNEAHAAAWWRVNTYAEPSARVPALSVDLLALDTATQALVLAAEPGTRFTVTGLPSQAASSTADYFVEGAAESIGPESYVVTFNVSDATPYVNTLILDSATRGLLDTNRLAY